MDIEKNIDFGQGKLKKTKPESLISAEGKVDDFDSFFLTLSLIFNDIKGLVYFDEFVKLNTPNKFDDLPTGIEGESTGLNTQIFKIAASYLFEFMKFLEKNKKIVNDDKFSLYLRKLSGENRNIWNLLYNVVLSKKDDMPNNDLLDFKKILTKIRSNVSFHYYQSGKSLVEGYREHFFINKKCKKEFRDYAYYSIKKTNFYKNRFYYADAAINGYINKTLGFHGEVKDVSGKIIQLSGLVSLVIVGLLDIYLEEKKCI